jgi:hypothetical protein
LPYALTARWDGRRWSIQRLPGPGGRIPGGLDAVACVSPRACVAVGYRLAADRERAAARAALERAAVVRAGEQRSRGSDPARRPYL